MFKVSTEATVFIVDDHAEFRASLRVLLTSVGLNVRDFASGQEFLDAHTPDQAGCAVLDVRMPGMSGLELQQRMRDRGISLPIIFLSGHGDVPLAVRALKAGAMTLLEKPVSSQELIDQVQHGIDRDLSSRRRNRERASILARMELLTPREREVLEGILAGQANKVIAKGLRTGERNVEYHRAGVMKKMEAESLAELIRMVLSVQEPPA